MLRKGLRYGDDEKLDRERRRVFRLNRSGEYEEALLRTARALIIIEEIVIDETFVQKKLQRFNKRLETTEEAPDLEFITRDLAATIESGDYAKANTLLNGALDALGP